MPETLTPILFNSSSGNSTTASALWDKYRRDIFCILDCMKRGVDHFNGHEYTVMETQGRTENLSATIREILSCEGGLTARSWAVLACHAIPADFCFSIDRCAISYQQFFGLPFVNPDTFTKKAAALKRFFQSVEGQEFDGLKLARSDMEGGPRWRVIRQAKS